LNYGPLIFLAAFLAMATSWYGLVAKPAMQMGRLGQTNTLGGKITYPVARPGLAAQGRDVYRANGCVYCHSQQVGQTGTVFQVVLTESGTNRSAALSELQKALPSLQAQQAEQALGSPPRVVLTTKNRANAESVIKSINGAGAKASLQVTPVGPDLSRGWGKRRNVAEDYLYDSPVMLGSQRVGPDLANVGSRLADPQWHLRHLYAPGLDVKGSTMPPYRYLFDVRKIAGAPSPNALQLSGDFAPTPGFEVVPTAEATALAAYLVSLRSDVPLFSSPLNVASAGPVTGGSTGTATANGTNAPAAGTNAP